WSAAPGVPAYRNEIPEPIERAIANGSLAKKYELSYRMNPFYPRGDFDGDSKIDVAALVKERSTGKFGIAIVHGSTGKVTISEQELPLVMAVMTLSGWISGGSTPGTTRLMKQVLQNFAATRSL